jgi:hypothetical protein
MPISAVLRAVRRDHCTSTRMAEAPLTPSARLAVPLERGLARNLPRSQTRVRGSREEWRGADDVHL